MQKSFGDPDAPNTTDVIRASYGHLDRIDVAVGDTVRVGDVIGTSGNTGCSDSPHLHFQAARLLEGREVVIDHTAGIRRR